MGAKSTVIVGMSGGVDSSVAAALLLERGYQVIGVMLKLWSDDAQIGDNRCCAPDAMAQARRVAAILGIPFYVVDAQDIFKQHVVGNFIDGYLNGLTPNPCLVCNQWIRWGFLFELSRSLGVEFLATGHYARLLLDKDGHIHLHRAVDRRKDQSYVISVVTQEKLTRTLFPLGEMVKTTVRQKALDLQLPVANRPDSQDLCFSGDGDYRDFLKSHAPHTFVPGSIINREGKIVGTHDGLANYTIGQRKGLRISGPRPLYVINKDVTKNQLVVGTADELGGNFLNADAANWIAGETPAGPIHATVQIRYKAVEEEAIVTPDSKTGFSVLFSRPVRDITPGQRAVIYQGDECLGGGTIASSM